MSLGLEFLHSDDDILDFVDYLYDHGFSLSHRCKEVRSIFLDRRTAIQELQNNLHTGWSTYYLGDATNRKLLAMDSCGPQSHPSMLGRRGRRAGVIQHIDKDGVREKELMSLLRSYFKRNYKFQRYNGSARMSCYFGPCYSNMEEAFFKELHAEDLCCGYLCIICNGERAEIEKERTTIALERLAVKNIMHSVHPYRQDSTLTQLNIHFLYRVSSFSVEAYSAAISDFSFNGRLRAGSSNSSFYFQNDISPELLVDLPGASSILLILQRP